MKSLQQGFPLFPFSVCSHATPSERREKKLRRPEPSERLLNTEEASHRNSFK